MNPTHRIRNVLIGGGVFGVLFFSAIFWGLPATQVPTGDSDSLEAKKQMLSRFRAQAAVRNLHQARQEQSQKRLASFEPLFLEVSDHMPPSSRLEEIVQKAAAESGLVVQRREPIQPGRIHPEYRQVTVRIDAQCTPEQFTAFLVAVRSFPRFLWITEISLRSSHIKNGILLYPSVLVSAIIKSPESPGSEKSGNPVISSRP